jgi:mycofactocin precursor
MTQIDDTLSDTELETDEEIEAEEVLVEEISIDGMCGVY